MQGRIVRHPDECKVFLSFGGSHGKAKAAHLRGVKYWEIMADNLSKAGFSWGWVSAIDSEGRTKWIADAHRDDGKRFIVHADEKLNAFLELEAAIRAQAPSLEYGLLAKKHDVEAAPHN